MNKIIFLLSILLIIILCSSSYENFSERFSQEEEKKLNETVEKSETKILSILKNIIENNKKFQVIQGPTGPPGPQGPAGSKGIIPPILISNKDSSNKIMTCQDEQSTTRDICNYVYMSDNLDKKFPNNNSKWNIVEGDPGHRKIQSVEKPEYCLSYDDNNIVFLARCDNDKYQSNWEYTENNQYKAENFNDKVNKCLSIGEIEEKRKNECSISGIDNILRLDECTEDDNKQIWTF